MSGKRSSGSSKSRRNRLLRLLRQQKYECYYCGDFIRQSESGEAVPDKSKGIATIEHIQPLSLGGAHTMESSNLVAACGWCNNGWAAMVDLWAFKMWSDDPMAVDWRQRRGL